MFRQFRQSNDSAAFARQLLDFEPDANQAKLLSTKAQYVIVNCHRQLIADFLENARHRRIEVELRHIQGADRVAVAHH